MNSNKTTFFLVLLLLVSAFCITMTESKCHNNRDCKYVKQPCPVPLACLFGSCICPWKNQSKFSTCQIICAHSKEKFITIHDSSTCVCGDK
ncbi:hypothetical protein EUTSA_v10001205mg [Eutrema salsugineum]|uniref:Uncharacterized protein n=1 Tax=Eutrema salsugineum TaxID=72664 RepID=V4N3H8_EUTSA|nr:putative defensin-like protein 303 [Eutrema salsugineum]ESQ39836.1 hypothetical protein EUTSA_v10001205mg [Eutrema salsugineum]